MVSSDTETNNTPPAAEAQADTISFPKNPQDETNEGLEPVFLGNPDTWPVPTAPITVNACYSTAAAALDVSSPVQDKRRKRILNDFETALIEDFIKKPIANKVRPTFECVISSPACLPACMPACLPDILCSAKKRVVKKILKTFLWTFGPSTVKPNSNSPTFAAN